ncbi:unnamed protein product [Musa textilis]
MAGACRRARHPPPANLGVAYLRIRSNAANFDMNYVVVVHPVVFLEPPLAPHLPRGLPRLPHLLGLPLYFVRDEPLVALGRTVNDRPVLIALSVVTLVLLRTKFTSDVLISLLVGLRMVLIHAALRRTEEAAGPETYLNSTSRSQPISDAFTDATNPNRPAIAA